jgi:hypothetical protein
MVTNSISALPTMTAAYGSAVGHPAPPNGPPSGAAAGCRTLCWIAATVISKLARTRHPPAQTDWVGWPPCTRSEEKAVSPTT